MSSSEKLHLKYLEGYVDALKEVSATPKKLNELLGRAMKEREKIKFMLASQNKVN